MTMTKKKEAAKTQVKQAPTRKSHQKAGTAEEQAAKALKAARDKSGKFIRVGHRTVRRPETRVPHSDGRGGSEMSPVRKIDPTCDTKPIRVDGAGRIFGQKPIPEDVRQMFTKLVPECIAVLADLMHNAEKEKDRIAAANAIIAYGYGKPESITRVHMDVQGLKRDQVAEVVRAELCNQAAEQAAGITQKAIAAASQDDSDGNTEPQTIVAELA